MLAATLITKNRVHICLPTKIIDCKKYASSSRALMRRAGNVLARNNGPVLTRRSYATDRYHTPIPTESSNDGLNNNPAIPFARKNKKSTVVQHPEWVKTKCDQPGCDGKFCLNLCGQKTSAKSVAHFTHDDKQPQTQKLSDSDFDGVDKPVFAKAYDVPHETSGKSYCPEKDERCTKILQDKLQELEKNAKDGKDI